MNSTRVPTIAFGAGGIADPALIERKADDRASAPGESVHVARCGVPIPATMQKRPEGRPT
jgi:hypothetical protein